MWFQRIFRRAEKSEDIPVNRKHQRVSLPAQAIRQLDRLQLRAARELRGEVVGQRPSSRRKPAAYFREHRMYVPGDDVRYVDWKSSARHEQIFIKQGEYPKEATVYLLLDCSASMAWGEVPKNASQLSLSAALGYLALSHGDRVFVKPLGGHNNQPIGPLNGKGQIPSLISYLQKLNYQGEVDLLQEVRDFNRGVSWGGLSLILSDLLGVNDMRSVLDHLPSPTWDVSVIHLLHAEEISPLVSGEVQMVDIETEEIANYNVNKEAVEEYKRIMVDWQRDVDLACVEKHAQYMLIPTDWLLEREIIAHLRDVGVVQPL
jgi:uncharacterized protein (DUF58 family)